MTTKEYIEDSKFKKWFYHCILRVAFYRPKSPNYEQQSTHVGSSKGSYTHISSLIRQSCMYSLRWELALSWWTCEAVLLWCGRTLMYLQPTQQMFSTGGDQPHTWRSFCFMYSQILLTTADRGNALSPVPRNFTRASERGVGLRKPEVPPFCCFFFLFGSSESTWN